MNWEQILAIAGAIVLISNAGAAIYRWIRPALKMKDKIETLESDVESLKKYTRNDSDVISHLKEMNKLQCQGMLCMINHMIDGNGREDMKQTRNQIQELIAKM